MPRCSWALPNRRGIHRLGTASGVSYHLLQMLSHQPHFPPGGCNASWCLLSGFKFRHHLCSRCVGSKETSENYFQQSHQLWGIFLSEGYQSSSVQFWAKSLAHNGATTSQSVLSVLLKHPPLYCRGRQRILCFSKVSPGERNKRHIQFLYMQFLSWTYSS